jgi:hypothetical protein
MPSIVKADQVPLLNLPNMNGSPYTMVAPIQTETPQKMGGRGRRKKR